MQEVQMGMRKSKNIEDFEQDTPGPGIRVLNLKKLDLVAYDQFITVRIFPTKSLADYSQERGR